jgi:hypothetical protein
MTIPLSPLQQESAARRKQPDQLELVVQRRHASEAKAMHSKSVSRISTPSTAHIEELLDEALRQTFPASDPVAIAIERDTGEDVEVARPGTAAAGE